MLQIGSTDSPEVVLDCENAIFLDFDCKKDLI